ncbi:MAG TPA: site-2 protease family protein, partial [Gemmataceae bacterium]|nr:site-2 protease family protein [Gemmataceae bacterium]
MRDPMSWALPLFRAYGIQVKLHIFFIIFTLGMFLRQVGMKGNPIWWVDVLFLTVVLLFAIILLHEFGHCFGARSVGGDAKDVLIWPLGGLAYVEIPHNPRAHFVTTAAGPAVNVAICVVCAIGLLAGGYRANLNPLADPYITEIRHANGKTYTSEYGLRLYKPGTSERVLTPLDALEEQFKETSLRGRFPKVVTPGGGDQIAAMMGAERAVAPGWAVWLQRGFTLSWLLFLFNLIPAYPLDGGQLLQAMIWKRSDYRRGVTVAAYSGFVVAVLFLIVAVWQNEAL